MVKRLVLHNKGRGGTLLAVSLAIILLFAGIDTKAATTVSCDKANWTGSVPCTSPEAAICNGPQTTFVQHCADLGFLVYVGEGEHCVEATCSTPIGSTQVPELEDYAAAMLLGLALIIGWQVRRRSVAN